MILLNARQFDRHQLILLAFEDITESRRSMDALRDSEQRFRQLADSMPQLVWTAQADGTIDYFNRRSQEYGGMEMVGGGFGYL